MTERILSLGRMAQGVNFNVQIRMDFEEMLNLLSQEQVSAIMNGIALVLNAAKQSDPLPAPPTERNDK